MTVRNGTLIIVELEPSDSGNYTCSSENSVGLAAVSSHVSVAGKQSFSGSAFARNTFSRTVSVFSQACPYYLV